MTKTLKLGPKSQLLPFLSFEGFPNIISNISNNDDAQVKDVRVPEQLMRAMAAEAEAARDARAKVMIMIMMIMINNL